MKNWTIAALFCMGMASLGTGCLLYDDGNNTNTIAPPENANQFVVEYSLLSGDNNALVSCSADIAEVQLVTLDDASKQTVDTFKCDDGDLVSQELPDGVYGVYLNFMDVDGNLYAQSEILEGNELSAKNPGPLKLHYDVSIDRASFDVAWEIRENTIKRTCAELQSDKVDVETTAIDDANMIFPDSFACTDGVALTRALPLGDYSISLAFKDQNAVIGAPIVKEGSLIFGSQVNQLDVFVFNLQPQP